MGVTWGPEVHESEVRLRTKWRDEKALRPRKHLRLGFPSPWDVGIAVSKRSEQAAATLRNLWQSIGN